MRVLTPETDPLWPHADIFLAGSTTGRLDWQARVIDLIAASAPDLTVANPRPRRAILRRHRAILRRHRAIPSYRRQARARIAWEHDHLMRARLVLAWLTADHDVRPIDLLELGAGVGDLFGADALHELGDDRGPRRGCHDAVVPSRRWWWPVRAVGLVPRPEAWASRTPSW